ncbi:hypothetical protein Clacol_007873 [Clathrus columnatus]|uniref:F-box domain-containing protein n=1 Tax=Clathrus columnatus TaxID=1419009 RepID=A0AAV5AIV0_9AGAM|nr:hypothetical protein Clacol_007873 [Clathrus columnatus]
MHARMYLNTGTALSDETPSSSTRTIDVSILRSDYVPNEAESSEIKNSIATFEQNKIYISSRLVALRAQVQALEEEEQRIENELFLRQAIIAPVRKLIHVPEILAEIFEYCLDDAPSFSSERMPLLLTHICRPWSDLAKRCPRLWTQISVPHYTDNSENVPLATWLDRSSCLPLDLSIRATGRPIVIGDDENQPESLIGNRLIECKKLSIVDYRGGYLVSRLPISTQCTWSYLQTLILKCANRPFDHLKTQENIWNLPCLQTLELLNSPFILSALRVPLPKLRVFRMTATTIPHDHIPHRIWRKFFTSCTSLEEVDIHMVYLSHVGREELNPVGVGDLDTITWPHLRRLKVYLPQTCDAKELEFLLCLYAPRLEYFQVDGYRWAEGDSVFDAVYNVIYNSQHSLQRLTLKSVDFSIGETMLILKLCKNVTRMKISSKVILRALIPSNHRLDFSAAHHHHHHHHSSSTPTPTTSTSSLTSPSLSPPPVAEWICPKLKRLKLLYDCAASMDFLELVERRSVPDDLRYRTSPDLAVHFLERVEVHVRDPGAWTVVGGLFGRIKRFRRGRPDIPILGLDRYMDEVEE